MNTTKNPSQKCFGCELTENEKPLVSIKYRGKKLWACLECLPKILHGKKNVDDYI